GPADLVLSLLARILDHAVMCALVIGASGFVSVTGRVLLVIVLGTFYAALMLPYRMGLGTYLHSPSIILSRVNAVLCGLLFCLIGIQLALVLLQKLEAPSRVNDPGPVLAFAILAVPFVHGIARAVFGLPGGFLALLFLVGTLYQFAPRSSRKKQLKLEAAAPLLRVT
ncbi:MAG: hypothetical protein KDN18_21120, partial [Verrucomicrobiae bacterium]|nr:hypothetical protein [Verrucomicrobiae bacterium]